MRIAIVGGGISGLATAFYLTKTSPGTEVLLYEQAPVPGGTMRTVERAGFLFETGSNGFLTNKPDTLNLVRESGAEALLMPSSDAARKRFIYTDRLHRLPESPPAFLTTPLLSMAGKLRTLGEVFIPARMTGEDESLRDFGYRRLGREFTDVFLNAMTAGIYASSPEQLSVQAAFPAVARLEREYGGLFKGMLKKRSKQAGPGGILMSFKGGVGSFVEHLSNGLGKRLFTDTAVQALEPMENGYRLILPDGEERVDRLVLATPAYTSADLLEPLDPTLAARLRDIHYSPIAVVGFGYRELAHPLDGFGLLTTAGSGVPVLGILWDSSIFPDRAPPGGKSLRVMIGGQRSPELALQNDERLVDTALAGIRTTMGVDAAPDVTFVQRWDRGIPSYRVGHLANLEKLSESVAALPNLYLNSNAYRGVSLNDCTANSRDCAERIVSSPGNSG